MKKAIRIAVLGFLLTTGYCLLATPAASAQSISDRIQRGCGGLGGDLVRVLTDFDGSVRIKLCTGGSVFICTSLGVCTAIPPPGTIVTGSGTAGTLPIWTAATVLGNSFATQSGNSFIVNQNSTGSIRLGRLGAGRPNFLVDDNTQLLAARINATNYFYVDGANDTAGIGRINSRAEGKFDATNFITTLGDVSGGGGGTRATINDGTQQITLFAQTAAVVVDGATSNTNIGDVNGLGNSTVVSINDSTKTITAQIGAASYLTFNGLASTAAVGKNSGAAQVLFDATAATSTLGDTGSIGNSVKFIVADTAQTFTLSNANYFNCLTLGTDAAGVVTCTVSDIGLKNNLAPFTRGLYAINQLRPSFWTFNKGRYYHNGDRFAGLLAQDVQKAIPEAVSETGNHHLQINPVTIQATLVNAVQELSAQVEELKKELAALRESRPAVNRTKPRRR